MVDPQRRPALMRSACLAALALLAACDGPPKLHIEVKYAGDSWSTVERRLVARNLVRLVEQVSGVRAIEGQGADAFPLLLVKSEGGKKIEIALQDSGRYGPSPPRHFIKLRDNLKLRYDGMEAFLRHAYHEYLTEREAL